MNITPEWIEAIATAIAALFAIVGSIIALLAYRKDKREQQDQINALVGQTNAIRDSVKIDSQILDQLTKHFAFNNELVILQNKKEKLLNKPHFQFKGGGSSIDNYQLRLVNVGNNAIINLFELNDSSKGFNISSDKKENATVKENEIINFNIIGNRGLSYGTLSLNFKMYFWDKTEQNLYFQTVKIDKGVPEINEPEEVQ